jgi:hypothetical protein
MQENSGREEEVIARFRLELATRGRSERERDARGRTTNGSERLRRRIGRGRKAEEGTRISSVGRTTNSVGFLPFLPGQWGRDGIARVVLAALQRRRCGNKANKANKYPWMNGAKKRGSRNALVNSRRMLSFLKS